MKLRVDTLRVLIPLFPEHSAFIAACSRATRRWRTMTHKGTYRSAEFLPARFNRNDDSRRGWIGWIAKTGMTSRWKSQCPLERWLTGDSRRFIDKREPREDHPEVGERVTPLTGCRSRNCADRRYAKIRRSWKRRRLVVVVPTAAEQCAVNTAITAVSRKTSTCETPGTVAFVSACPDRAAARSMFPTRPQIERRELYGRVASSDSFLPYPSAVLLIDRLTLRVEIIRRAARMAILCVADRARSRCFETRRERSPRTAVLNVSAID